LSGVLALVNLKARFGWSDKSFTELFVLLKKMLPEQNTFPKNHYEAEKILCPMGMEYQKIHACPNDSYCIEISLQKCISAPHVGYHGTKSRIMNSMMMQAKKIVVQQKCVGIFQ